MSDAKLQRELESLLDALEDEPITDGDIRDVVTRLGVDVNVWASEVRERVAAANDAERKERFDDARRAYRRELQQLSDRSPEPSRTLAEQRALVKQLLARAPQGTLASVHAHKFEQATEQELAEMIRSLRHLLGDDGEL
jgi:predicted metal-dependent enzyme (double-stranded beta helix superfamily)